MNEKYRYELFNKVAIKDLNVGDSVILEEADLTEVCEGYIYQFKEMEEIENKPKLKAVK